MWLSIVLLVATAAPQQGSSNLGGGYIGKVPQIKSLLGTIPQPTSLRGPDLQQRGTSPDELQVKNTCYTVRSYHFKRQDGQAPVLTGMTTCTPARVLEQKRVSPAPGVKLIPMSLKGSGENPAR